MTDTTTPVAGDSATTHAAGEAATSPEQTQNALTATEGAQEGAQQEAEQEPSQGDAEADKSAKGKQTPEQRKAAGQFIKEQKRRIRQLEAELELRTKQLQSYQKPAEIPDNATDEQREEARLESIVRKTNVAQTRPVVEELTEAAHRARVETFQAICEEVSDRMPDLHERFSNLPCSMEMATEILESDKGAEIAMYLVNHPKEARDIADLPPARQAAAIARLEGRLQTAVEVRKHTSTPPPTGSLKGSGGQPSFDPKTASVADIQKRLFGG